MPSGIKPLPESMLTHIDVAICCTFYLFFSFIFLLHFLMENYLLLFDVFQVFSASNVELITKTRTEHLTEQDKEKTRKLSKNPLESFLGIAEQHDKETGATANGVRRYGFIFIYLFIEPWTKCSPFCWWYFQMYFLERKCGILIKFLARVYSLISQHKFWYWLGI